MQKCQTQTEYSCLVIIHWWIRPDGTMMVVQWLAAKRIDELKISFCWPGSVSLINRPVKNAVTFIHMRYVYG